MKRRSFSGSGKSANQSEEIRMSNISSVLGVGGRRQNVDHERHVVMLKETLVSIAERFYGDADYWILLALKNDLSTEVDHNGIPVEKLTRGQVIRLPDYYELESFERNPEAPIIVALYTDEDGFQMPRTRTCFHCGRETLAMAIGCIACLTDLDNFADEDEEDDDDESEVEVEEDDDEVAEDEEDDEESDDELDDDEWEEEVVIAEDDHQRTTIIQPAASNFTKATDQPPAQGEPRKVPAHAQDQDRTIISDPRTPERQDQTVVQRIHPAELQSETLMMRSEQLQGRIPTGSTQPPTDSSIPGTNQPVPHKTGGDRDPFWTPIASAEILDRMVRVTETQIDGDMNGLLVTLELQVHGQWKPIFEYHVFPDDVVIVQHQHVAGRRRQKKSLPARQSKKMAWNHFRGNWQKICDDFWAS